MSILLVKRLNEEAQIPTYGSSQAAGLDLYANEHVVLSPKSRVAVNTGIAISIPVGYVGLIWPRSGLAYNNGIDVLAGVIDSDYRGEIKVILLNTDEDQHMFINVGDRIAQLVIQVVESVRCIEVKSFDETERGEKGFGHTGK